MTGLPTSAQLGQDPNLPPFESVRDRGRLADAPSAPLPRPVSGPDLFPDPDVAAALGTVAEGGGSWADIVADAMDMSVADLWRDSQEDVGSASGSVLTDSQILAGVPMRSPALD